MCRISSVITFRFNGKLNDRCLCYFTAAMLVPMLLALRVAPDLFSFLVANRNGSVFFYF